MRDKSRIAPYDPRGVGDGGERERGGELREERAEGDGARVREVQEGGARGRVGGAHVVDGARGGVDGEPGDVLRG